jgi:hypothetical protein
VVITSHEHGDDEYDLSVDADEVLSCSFYEWLLALIKMDGIPDPYINIGPEGGFLDPV